jgi:membrane protein YqaA with SNARE-associated domain
MTQSAPQELPVSAPRTHVPHWHLHRRLYDWALSWAHWKWSGLALFLLAFAESSFFPVPPDVLQIALTLERRKRAFFYAFVSTIGSVLGGMLGYAIGWGAWEAVSEFFFRHLISQGAFHKVEELYQQHDFWAVFVAAFTPIPYKVFTIAAGVFHISLPMFILASAVGRAGRFFLVAGLLYLFGPPVRTFIEKYFNLLTLVGAVMVITAVAIARLW